MTILSSTRRAGSLVIAIALLGVTAQAAVAAAPSNDVVSGATPLKLNTPIEFNSAEATVSPSVFQARDA